MRIKVDLDVCDAHGACVMEAPELFALDDDDETVRVLQADVPEGQAKAAERAAQSCPVQAITLGD